MKLRVSCSAFKGFNKGTEPVWQEIKVCLFRLKNQASKESGKGTKSAN